MKIITDKSYKLKEDSMRIREEKEYVMKECGSILEVKTGNGMGRKGSIRKIGDNKYVVISTGEIREFGGKDDKDREKNTVGNRRRALMKCRDLINANYDDIGNAIFLTLTYAQITGNIEQVGKDFTAFIRVLRRKISRCEYIYVVEKQGRGSWHIHAILFFQSAAPFISNCDVEKMWGHGEVDTQKVDNCERLALYLSSNVVNDDNTAKIKNTPISEYDKGVRIFRGSKGLKKPIISEKKGSEVLKSIEGMTLIHETNYEYTAPNGFHSIVCKNTYKKKI